MSTLDEKIAAVRAQLRFIRARIEPARKAATPPQAKGIPSSVLDRIGGLQGKGK